MNVNTNILILENEITVRDSMYKFLVKEGYSVSVVSDIASALSDIHDRKQDIVIFNIHTIQEEGTDFIKDIKSFNPAVSLIALANPASVDYAVQLLKLGLYEFITEPINLDHLSHIINNILKEKKLSFENLKFRESISAYLKSGDQICESPGITNTLDLLASITKTEDPVLILGECGTGKKLLARTIHANSSRRYYPFISVNCSSTGSENLRSKLFGNDRDTFKNVKYRKKGILEIAAKGTIFIDKISGMNEKIQTELSHAIETKKFTRIGGSEEIESDFRIISAATPNIENAVKSGSFSEELYNKLSVFVISLPPLRERKSDIPILAQHFIDKFSEKMSRPIDSLSPDTLDIFMEYNWPKNIRELKNAVERAIIAGKTSSIKPDDLPSLFGNIKKVHTIESLNEIEKKHIVFILEKTGWNITHSAEKLGIDRVTLYNKIEKYGLRK